MTVEVIKVCGTKWPNSATEMHIHMCVLTAYPSRHVHVCACGDFLNDCGPCP